MTFVRVRLALDRMTSGETLLVRLRGEEPRRNIPRTAVEQGHALLEEEDRPDGTALLLLRKG
ncbi:sulfurtransferase TusA family protein [Belnapia sp. T6]|uniref:Sulfurtransferase TusA family protein n=1 Tax=Belnapia mucosa TaxID=2804532 RepID=A0ABS1V2Y6_9PROT|nr:sulfurtransferase TusA family protein [Belnapia mucosa]MBL6456054.1 sulfurtransferase TusA family protein [Belnapia mucosa]